MAHSRTTKLIFWCLVTTMAPSCASTDSHCDRGTLTDNGIFAANERYVLDLGTISLSQPAARNWCIAGLPAGSYVLGFDFGVIPISPEELEKELGTITIDLLVRDDLERELSRSNQPISSWTWSVKRGEHGNSLFIYPGDRAMIEIDPKRHYEISMHSDQSHREPPFQEKPHLQLKSGGWK